jgi:hypothetical protein
MINALCQKDNQLMVFQFLPETLAFAINLDLAYELRGDGELAFVTKLSKASP